MSVFSKSNLWRKGEGDLSDRRNDIEHAAYGGVTRCASFVMRACVGLVPLLRDAVCDSEQVSQILYGELVSVHGEQGDFYLVCCDYDGYVGFACKSGLCESDFSPHTWVSVDSAPLFAEADIKSTVVDFLSIASRVDGSEHGDFLQITIKIGGEQRQAYIYKEHVCCVPLKPCFDVDYFIRTARRFMGRPYIWGGRSAFGLDCSGLVQLSLMLLGLECQRDADMQAVTLGVVVDSVEDMQVGDIIYWHGHVGIYTGRYLLHAYGRPCIVVEQLTGDIFPLLKRATKNDICAIRRIV